MDKQLKVKFKIGNIIEFEAEGQTEAVEKERQEFLSQILPAAIRAVGETRVNNIQNEVVDIPVSNVPVLESEGIEECSINEFLNNKGFSKQIDIALGLIYYKEVLCKVIDVNSDELKTYFSEAKIPKPSNVSDVIGKLVGKAMIMNSNDKGRYKLTRKGIQFVEEFIPSQKKKTSKTKASSKTSSSGSKETYQMNKELNLSPNDRDTFQHFYDIKQPNTAIEKNIVSVYYLEKILEKKDISIDDIYTCYKHVNARIPKALRQSLVDTSSSKYGYINTANNYYTVSTVGENFVNFDLPKKK
jgi:hypothetical protein